MDENQKKIINDEWDEEDKKQFLNKNLSRAERDFIRELIYIITTQKDIPALEKCLEKNGELIKDSPSLIDEIYIVNENSPDMSVNALFAALVYATQTGDYDKSNLLIKNGAKLTNFTKKLFEKPSSTPAAEAAPEQVEKNWKDKMKEGLEKMKFWKKPEQQAGKRRTKKQRKSRKQRK
jgi:hypothetical protein